MSEQQQEKSAGNTTELADSKGSVEIDNGLDDVSNYAAEVQALLEGDSQEEQSRGEETFEEETQETEETETETEDQSEETEDEEEEERPDTSNANRYRIKARNDVERTAFALHKANPSWTMEQAIGEAKKIHPEQATESTTHDDTEDESPEVVQSQIDDLKQKRKEAIKEFDAELQIELEDQLEVLRDKKAKLSYERTARAATEEQRFYAEADQATNDAVQLYPDAANPQSALAKEMARIDRDMIATDNPLLYDPKKALRIAQMAANNLAIAPRSTQSKNATVKKVSTRPALQPSSGSTRSAATSVALDRLDDPNLSLTEYEEITNGLR
jgi:hypothetical protein